MNKPDALARIALICAAFVTVAGCEHPPEAGSLDPHGKYTADEARAAGIAALKARGAVGRPPGGKAPVGPSGAPGKN